MAERSHEGNVLAEGAMPIGEAVAFSGQSRTAIYDAMAGGSLPYFTKGCRRFIAKKDLIAWLGQILQPARP
ncbi:MAG: helix-turn-helix domain-containing protein [Planctomycetes bacterium]|nr:helix-turn-helix domain-containing protein [Planctomycetota bacterium]